jgi:hypothetical protein
MLPWESWNARDAAWLRIERASARTIEACTHGINLGVDKRNQPASVQPSPHAVEALPADDTLLVESQVGPEG